MLKVGLAKLVCNKEDVANIEENVAKYLETKDELLLDSIFKGVIRFTHDVRRKYYFIDSDEFYSDANLAMFKAIDSYDSTKGCKFTTHYGTILYRTMTKRIRDNHRLKRKSEQEPLSMNKAYGTVEDTTLEDAIPTKEDIFDTVFARYIIDDVKSSERFSEREKNLFMYKYVEELTLSEIVGKNLYTSTQSASRASIRLRNKLQTRYGGC